METQPLTPQNSAITPVLPFTNTCKNCSTSFSSKKPDTQFCADRCRAQYHRKMRGALSDDATESPKGTSVMVATLGALPPQAQYIIEHQRTVLADKKAELSRLQVKYDAQKKENAELREKLAKLDTDHKIEALQNAKPSGLQGLAQTLGSLPPELLGSLTPALERIVDKIFGQGQPAAMQITGTDGQQADPEARHKMLQFGNWFASLPRPLQESIYGILVTLASSPNEQVLQRNLTKITNLLKQNGTGNQSVPLTGTY